MKSSKLKQIVFHILTDMGVLMRLDDTIAIYIIQQTPLTSILYQITRRQFTIGKIMNIFGIYNITLAVN